MASISVPTIAAVGSEAAADGAAAATAAAAASATAATVGTAAGTAALTASTAASLGTAAAGAVAAAPTLGAIAAGGSMFSTLASGASLLTGAVGADGQHQAGVAQKNDDAMRARQAGLDAAQKQIGIRQNMLSALASQNAAAGQGGIGTGGSFGANVNRQITQNQNDLLALSADTSAQQAQYGAAGANAAATGNIKAGQSLLDTAGNNGQNWANVAGALS